jgi:predicted ATPase/CheY-like chemotaxis protein
MPGESCTASEISDPRTLILEWRGVTDLEMRRLQKTQQLLTKTGRRPGASFHSGPESARLHVSLAADECALTPGQLSAPGDLILFGRQLLELMLQLQLMSVHRIEWRPALLSWSPQGRKLGLLSLHPSRDGSDWNENESEDDDGKAWVLAAARMLQWLNSAAIPDALGELLTEMTAESPSRRPDPSLCLMAFDLLAADRGADLHALLAGRHAPALRPPQLCGRLEESLRLQEHLQSASRGARVICLISAESGTGKTRLVEEFGLQARAQAVYASGKAEQYQHEQPLRPLSQCLAGLAGQVASRGLEEARQLRLRLHEALGREAGVIAAAFPALAELLDLSRQPSAIPPSEGPRRLQLLAARTLNAICGGKVPVLFLDDLQWADAESLGLLEHLLCAPHACGLLVVAAVRESRESEFSQSLQPMLHAARSAGSHVEHIQLKSLSPVDSAVLTSSILRGPVARLGALQRLVGDKCRGNPFQIQQFLRAAIERGEIRAELDGWTWDTRLESAAAADKVALLVVARIRRLPPELHLMLHAAAVLGYEFDSAALQSVTELAPPRLQSLLADAEGAGLLIGSGERWRFFHDRVQQAAISLRDEEETRAVHLACARALTALGASPAEILGHQQAALPLLDPAARKDFAALALRCCRASLAAGSLRTALKQCRGGRAALRLHEGIDPALSFQLLAAECQLSFLNADHESAEKLALEALPLAPGYQERADIRLVQITWRTFAARYEEAIALAVDALGELGVELPPRGDDKLSRSLVDEALAHPALTRLEQLPLMTDPRLRCILQLMASLGPPTYRYRQSLWAVLVPRAVLLILAHGWAPQGAYMFPAFGGLCTHYQLGFDPARRFGEAATSLVARDGDSSISSVFHLMNGSSVSHWLQSRQSTLAEYAASRRDGLASGNLQYAGYAYGHALYTELLSGHSLDQVASDASEWLAFGKSARNLWLSDLCSAVLACVSALREHQPCDPAGRLRDEIASRGNRQVLCLLHIFRTLVGLHQNRDEEARLDWLAAAGLIDTVSTQGLLPAAEHHFLGILLDGRRGRAPAAADLERLKQQAEACPAVWKARLHLAQAIAAESYGAAAEFSLAAAIAASPSDAALAWSCARRFWLRCNEEGYAAAAAAAAAAALLRWGCSLPHAAPATAASPLPDESLAALRSASTDEAAAALLRIACAASGAEEAELLLKDGWHLSLREGQVSPPRESSFAIRRCLSREPETGSLDDNGDFLICLDSGDLKAALRLARPGLPPADAAGKLALPLLVLTRCRQLEKLRQVQKAAEVAASEQSAFLSLLCHEIRTPLNAVLGSLEAHPELKGEGARLISGSCRKLMRLSDCITHFSGLQDGSLRPRLQNVRPGEILQEAVAQAEEMVFLAGKEMEIRSDLHLPDTALSDPRLLLAALQQILSNACEHGAGPIEVIAKSQRGQGEITVRDHGGGFPAALLGLDLHTAVHARSISARRSGGLGLGLAVSTQCASLLGGSLQLRNVEGGAEAILRLPLPEPLGREASAPSRPESCRRLLVVDDNRSNQLVASRCLESLGWKVDIASDGAEALKLFDPSLHCLIFMDVLMPVMDGIEATRCLRLRPDTQKTPIIALTANATTHDREACLSAGMDEFLVKPVSKKAFADCLGRYFQADEAERP